MLRDDHVIDSDKYSYYVCHVITWLRGMSLVNRVLFHRFYKICLTYSILLETLAWKYKKLVLQCETVLKVITKCDRSLLQSALGITKCDRLLLQSASSITKCDSYYKVKHNTTTYKDGLANSSYAIEQFLHK